MPTLSLDRLMATTVDTAGGKPRIAGRRITVDDVAIWHERMGKSVDEICAEQDLTLAEAHAALAYYFDNKAEIDARLASDDAWIVDMREATPSLLGPRLKSVRGV